MKVDLTAFLRKDSSSGWSQEDFKKHIKESLVELIRLELENIPRQEWDKTLRTWSKICSFADSLGKKEEKEREELYRKFQFDSMMVYITEGVIEKLEIARSIGLLKKGERPEKLISLGLEFAEESEETRFMKAFFRA
ncbi:MAG: hypothetical protein D6804_04775 [Aquificota bacterium]|jgi:hypothetical protein|nr:MAG: hypothetical protein D6804_04775 [Aquificota bacterium]